MEFPKLNGNLAPVCGYKKNINRVMKSEASIAMCKINLAIQF